MSLTVEQLEQEARKLDDEEQADLLGRLLSGLGRREQHGLDETVLREAHRRDQAMESGEDRGISADKVLLEMRALVGR